MQHFCDVRLIKLNELKFFHVGKLESFENATGEIEYNQKRNR